MKSNEETNFSQRRFQVILSILIAIAFLFVLRGGRLIYIFKAKPSDYDAILMSDSLGIIFAIIVMFLLGSINILREKKHGILKGLFIGGFLTFICAASLLATLTTVQGKKLLPLSSIIVFTLAMIAVGMAEEFIFRGIILNLLIDRFGKSTKGIWIAVIISSIIFGCAHISNIFAGVHLKAAFIQAMGTIAVGALIAAIYLRTRNIWVVVFLHAFMDFSSLIGAGFFGVSSFTGQVNQYGYIKLVSVAIYFIPVFILLRGSKMKEIIENV
ncbi:CPBP family intramembrane metalloprotease [Clostridium felsineum]|uniref:CPBP family intramembrane glutamic endopeptidase n=1 Tax=Clostridium felsineum TaxID=36839 RepID=UPI00214DD2F3|nr:type II CAAX endopeptidase family protein [Clostridium felsineum]MCR3760670.1 CPBP family intramembrane metalloprotease [Clostridium felsineum]